MPNAIRNTQPLQSETGGALQPLTSTRPSSCSQMQVPPSQNLFGAITADSFPVPYSMPHCRQGCKAGFPRVSLCQEQALAPAVFRQQNKAGKTQPETQWHSCTQTELPQSHPEKFISPHGRVPHLSPACSWDSETKSVITDCLLFAWAAEILPSYCWFPLKLRPSHLTNIHTCSSGQMLTF